MSNNSIWKKFLGIDTRYLNIILLITLIFPLIRPLNLPVPVSKMTMDSYNLIEALDEGDIVFGHITLQPSDLPEIGGHLIVGINHVISKGAKSLQF